jgi:DnaB-like helicase N terminal domain/Protein of unknown function (DUF3987)
MPTVSEKSLPHSLDAERALLGSILLDADSLALVLPELGRDDFFVESHRFIFDAIADLHASNTDPDVVTLADRLTTRGQLERVGGISYLAALSDGVPVGDFSFVRNYIATIREKSSLRKQINSANNLIAMALEGTARPEQVAARFMAELEITGRNGYHGQVEMQEVAEEPEIDYSAGERPRVPEVCWRGPLAAFRDLVGPCVECSDNYLFAGFMTYFGAALGKTVYVRAKRPRIYLNNFTVICGPSAYANKGTGSSYVTDFFEEVSTNVRTIPNLDSWESFVGDVKALVEPDDPDEETRNMEGPPSIMLQFDEYNSLLIKAKIEGSKTFSELKKAWDSPRRNSWRVATRKIRLRANPMLSIFASSETKDLADMGERQIEGGLGNRQLFIDGDPKPVIRGWREPDEKDWLTLARSVKKIVQWWWGKAERVNDDESIQLAWTPEAEKIWWPWHDHYRERGKGDELMEQMSVRDRVHVLKTAGFYAAMEQSFVLLPEHINAGIAFVDFLLASRACIFKQVGVDKDVKLEQAMVEYVTERKGVPFVKFQRNYNKKLKREALQRTVNYMVANPDLPNLNLSLPKPIFPDRPLYFMQKIGKKNRFVTWLMPLTEEYRAQLEAQKRLQGTRPAGRG